MAVRRRGGVRGMGWGGMSEYLDFLARKAPLALFDRRAAE